MRFWGKNLLLTLAHPQLKLAPPVTQRAFSVNELAALG